MKGAETLFSRKSDEWGTPGSAFADWTAEFGFCVDAAATAENTLCAWWYGPDHPDPLRRNALSAPWDPALPHWCNPPYSKVGAFVSKAARERERGVLTVMLIPARTDTKWFHEFLWDRLTHKPRTGIELRLLKGRLRFEGAPSSAPFPSMIVVFRPEEG